MRDKKFVEKVLIMFGCRFVLWLDLLAEAYWLVLGPFRLVCVQHGRKVVLYALPEFWARVSDERKFSSV